MLAQAVLKSSSPESDEHELPKPSLRRQRRVAVPFWQPRGDNAENIAAPPTMRVDAKWIALAPMSGSIIPARQSFPDTEAETSLRLVRVHRQRMPSHAIAARSQASDAKAHHVATDARTVVDAPAPSAMHLRSAELWFELLSEVEHDLAWRGGNGAADRRACVIKKGVSLSNSRAAQDGHERQDDVEVAHDYSLLESDAPAKSGLPNELGYMSSR
jgi:hypothetical protein